jgi:hypothetical protein
MGSLEYSEASVELNRLDITCVDRQQQDVVVVVEASSVDCVEQGPICGLHRQLVVCVAGHRYAPLVEKNSDRHIFYNFQIKKSIKTKTTHPGPRLAV